jgi:hypothetical protein
MIASAPSAERSRLTSVATFSAGCRGGAASHSASTMLSIATCRSRYTASRANRLRALRLPISVALSGRPPRYTLNPPTSRNRMPEPAVPPACVVMAVPEPDRLKAVPPVVERRNKIPAWPDSTPAPQYR